MKPSLSRLPSPALVIACVALFVSLGGVSYGLAKGSIDSREIKDNTIRSKDVRNNTLRTFDIRNNEVRGFDIRNSTIQGRDVAFNTLTGNDVAESSLGKVPSATTADTATSAQLGGHPQDDRADERGRGRRAGHAGDARTADAARARVRPLRGTTEAGRAGAVHRGEHCGRRRHDGDGTVPNPSVFEPSYGAAAAAVADMRDPAAVPRSIGSGRRVRLRPQRQGDHGPGRGARRRRGATRASSTGTWRSRASRR